MNFNTGTDYPPPPYNPRVPPIGRRPMPHPISYPGMNSMRHPTFASYPRHRRPVRIYRRNRPRHCRPIVHVIRSDSCSSISTCSSISSCSYSRRCPPQPQQQQQQPIILLPIQCQQPSLPALTTSFQTQAQPIIRPAIQQSFISPSITNLSSTPIIIQPINTIPQGKPQQFQAGPIQYVQAPSNVQFISAKPISTVLPQPIIVNGTIRRN